MQKENLTRFMFIEISERMIEAFGGTKNFPAAKLDLLYARVKILSPDQYSQVVDLVMTSCSNTPSIHKILELAGPLVSEAWRQWEAVAKSAATSAPCSMCQNTYFVFAYDTQTRGHTGCAFHCSCELARTHNRNGTVWGDQYRPRWLPDFDFPGLCSNQIYNRAQWDFIKAKAEALGIDTSFYNADHADEVLKAISSLPRPRTAG